MRSGVLLEDKQTRRLQQDQMCSPPLQGVEDSLGSTPQCSHRLRQVLQVDRIDSPGSGRVEGSGGPWWRKQSRACK